MLEGVSIGTPAPRVAFCDTGLWHLSPLILPRFGGKLVLFSSSKKVKRVMKFEFTQSGGFAGLSKKIVLDTDDLSAEEQEELKTAAQNALPLPAAARTDGCDMMDYELSVDGQKTNLDDGTMTGPLKALYSLVEDKFLALKKAKKSQ